MTVPGPTDSLDAFSSNVIACSAYSRRSPPVPDPEIEHAGLRAEVAADITVVAGTAVLTITEAKT